MKIWWHWAIGFQQFHYVQYYTPLSVSSSVSLKSFNLPYCAFCFFNSPARQACAWPIENHRTPGLVMVLFLVMSDTLFFWFVCHGQPARVRIMCYAFNLASSLPLLSTLHLKEHFNRKYSLSYFWSQVLFFVYTRVRFDFDDGGLVSFCYACFTTTKDSPWPDKEVTINQDRIVHLLNHASCYSTSLPMPPG